MSAAMTAPTVSMHASPVPNPEVPQRPTRRRFNNEYKLRVLAETDAAPAGSIAAILRREGLYSSHLDSFRKQRGAGALNAAPRKRGPRSDPLTGEVAKLRRENERLRRDLENARLVIDVQKKVARLLGIPPQIEEES